MPTKNRGHSASGMAVPQEMTREATLREGMTETGGGRGPEPRPATRQLLMDGFLADNYRSSASRGAQTERGKDLRQVGAEVETDVDLHGGAATLRPSGVLLMEARSMHLKMSDGCCKGIIEEVRRSKTAKDQPASAAVAAPREVTPEVTPDRSRRRKLTRTARVATDDEAVVEGR